MAIELGREVGQWFNQLDWLDHVGPIDSFDWSNQTRSVQPDRFNYHICMCVCVTAKK